MSILSTPEQFREMLKDKSNEDLAAFLHGYAIGASADLFITFMAAPNQRVEFLKGIARTYPNDWKAAIEQLSK